MKKWIRKLPPHLTVNGVYYYAVIAIKEGEDRYLCFSAKTYQEAKYHYKRPHPAFFSSISAYNEYGKKILKYFKIVQ